MGKPNLIEKIRGRIKRYRKEIDPHLYMARLYITSAFRSRNYRKDFSHIERYCLFIGYPRSGHSLVGALLDAHPEMIIAHELDALRFIAAGFSKRQLFTLLLENSYSYAEAGRKWTGYSYTVPNQWQGTFKRLRVIGDKKGGKTSLWLQKKPELITLLQDTVEVPIKYIHVMRNPYDNISTIFRRKGKDIHHQIESYFAKCETVSNVIKQVGDIAVYNLRLESLIQDPIMYLRDLCDFLQVDATEEYLSNCASIVMDNPHKSRYRVDWSPELILHVQEMISRFHFLEGYCYDE